MMRKPKNGDDRILLLNQLRKAVALQVELWDVRLALSDTLERALKDVGDQRAIDPKTIGLFTAHAQAAVRLLRAKSIQSILDKIESVLAHCWVLEKNCKKLPCVVRVNCSYHFRVRFPSPPARFIHLPRELSPSESDIDSPKLSLS